MGMAEAISRPYEKGRLDDAIANCGLDDDGYDGNDIR